MTEKSVDNASRVARARAEFADYRYFEDDDGFDRDRTAARFAANEVITQLRNVADRTERFGVTKGVEGVEYVTGWNAAIGYALMMIRDRADEIERSIDDA